MTGSGATRAAALKMQATYNPALVALSIVVAILVSYTALALAARMAS
jgi:NO-binding membrane sensor protein with MHYT domain